MSAAEEMIVGTRDVGELLRATGHGSIDPMVAVEDGIVVRHKVEGLWLFAQSKEALSRAEEQVATTAISVCSSWLLAPMGPLVGTTAKELGHQGVLREAVQAFLRVLLRKRALQALPLLTKEYQPYFALFRTDDRPEIDSQLKRLLQILEKGGRVRTGDLGEPDQARDYEAWRSTLLQHGEYLGLGRIQDGALVSWHA